MGANTGNVYAGAAVAATAPTTSSGTGTLCLKKTLNVRISDATVISTA